MNWIFACNLAAGSKNEKNLDLAFEVATDFTIPEESYVHLVDKAASPHKKYLIKYEKIDDPGK